MADILAPAADAPIEPLMDCAAITAADEKWAPAAGFEGLYEVSDMGRVKSLRRAYQRSDGLTGLLRERILRPATRQRGHLHVVLRKNGAYHTRTVHRLVLEAFVGPRPRGLVCCHGNGNPQDNRLYNLRWDTPKANSNDARLHGTGNQGFRNPNARLTTELIIAIRSTAGTNRAVADAFGVNPETVRRIQKGLRWSDVEEV